jgi:hypothetical protein
MQLASELTDTARTQADAYQNGADRPLSSYTSVIAVFASMVTAAGGLAWATGRRLPAHTSPWDVFLLAVGTHKLSRTISKASVTAPLRAPFTQYSGSGGPAEVKEEVRESGRIRHSIGELITCPFCLDVWTATGLSIGLVFAPRLTRLATSALTALTGADFLQLAYAKAQQAAE